MHSATLRDVGQVGEADQNAMTDLMTVAEQPVLSTNYITKFPFTYSMYRAMIWDAL